MTANPETNAGSASRGLARAAVGGVAWVYLTYALGKLVVFGTTVVLARLLSVEAFGLVGYALVLVNFLDAIKDLGVEAALIAYRDDVKRARVRSTAFALTALSGVALTAAAVAAAGTIGSFFQQPEAVGLVQIMAFSFLFSGLGRTHDALLSKELGFRRRLIPEMGRSLMKGGVSIGLALMGFGAFSIAWGQVAGMAAAAVLSWLVYPWVPSLTFDRQVARRLVGFGVHIAGVNLLAALLLNLDYVLIGRFLGTEPLGLYTIAFRLPDLLLVNLCWVLSRVLFPIFARLSQDRVALREAYLSSVRYVAMAVVPLGLGLAATAPLVVNVLFGDKWDAAIPVLRILAVYSMLHALQFHSGDVFKALGRGSLLTRLNLAIAGVLLPTMAVGLVWGGIEGVAMAWVVTEVVWIALGMRVLRRELGVRPLQVLEQMRPALIAGAMMLPMIWLGGRLTDQPALIALTLQVLLGAATYTGVLLWLDRALPARFLALMARG